MLKFSVVLAVTCIAVSFGATSCGTEDPDDGLTGEYFPLEVGNYWIYEEVYADSTPSETIKHEVVSFDTVDMGHDKGERQVYEFVATPASATGALKRQWYEDDGTRMIRHRQIKEDSTVRNYVPGLLRFDRGKAEEQASWEEGTDYCDEGETTDECQYHPFFFEVLGFEEVTVPAGTFNCLKLRRRLTTNQEEKTYWFAAGIGKVKELTANADSGGSEGDKTEELLEYSVAGQ